MNLLSAELLNVVDALGWTLIHSVWQCGIVALLLQVFLKYNKSWSASSRSLLCIMCLLLCAALSVTTFSTFYQTSVSVLLQGEVSNVVPATTAGAFDHQFSFNMLLPYVVLLWSLGCAFFLVGNVLKLRLCYKLRFMETVEVSTQWKQQFNVLCKKVGVTRPADLRISKCVDVPCVIGHFKPVVLLPIAMLSNFPRDQLELVLLHELGHIRRNDYVIGLIQILLKTIYFFNPGVLGICRLLDIEREKACDDIAMSACNNPLIYAKALQEFATMKSNNNLAMSIAGNNHQLLTRIKRLFDNRANAPRPFEVLFAAAGVLLLGFVLASYANARSDQQEIADPDAVTVLEAADIEPQEAILPIHKVAASYPSKAIEDKVEGYCTVEFTVNEKGHTENASILECSHDGYFEKSALAAVSEFRYKPKVFDGSVVSIVGVRNKFTYTSPEESLYGEDLEIYLPKEKVAPIYPSDAVDNGVEGYCDIEYTVDQHGNTVSPFVIECSPEGYFEQSSVSAAKKFKYEPKVVDGKPVQVLGARNRFVYELDNE